MPSASNRSRIAAATAASVLGTFGLTTVVAGGDAVATAETAAGTAATRPGAATTVPALSQVAAGLARPRHSAALQTGSNAKLGAVTFVDDDLAGPPTVDIAVSRGSTSVGSLALSEGTFTHPQLLPAGSYHVTVTGAGSNTSVATGSLSVTASGASSEVLSDSATTKGAAPAGSLDNFADPIDSVPVNRTVVSVRDLSPLAGAVDVYVNGTKAGSDLAGGASADIALPPGTENVVVVPTGTPPTSGTPLFSGSFVAQPDAYTPLYVINDASQTSGVGVNTTAFWQGYQFTASDGGLFNYGSYPFLGSTGNIKLNQPMVGGAEATDDAGYWLVASDGGVFTFGNAPFLGSLGSLKLNSPIVGMAATVGPDGKPGYLLVGKDGGVFAFNASYFGSLGGQAIGSPVVGIAADPATGSYTLAEADGQWFTFGPGHPNNPTTGKVAASLNKPIVGIADTPDGGGAWLVASDGGIFTIGNAPFEGSAGNLTLNKPINSVFPTFDGLGYSLIASDGGVFNYGDARFYGSTGDLVLNEPVVGAVNT